MTEEDPRDATEKEGDPKAPTRGDLKKTPKEDAAREGAGKRNAIPGAPTPAIQKKPKRLVKDDHERGAKEEIEGSFNEGDDPRGIAARNREMTELKQYGGNENQKEDKPEKGVFHRSF